MHSLDPYAGPDGMTPATTTGLCTARWGWECALTEDPPIIPTDHPHGEKDSGAAAKEKRDREVEEVLPNTVVLIVDRADRTASTEAKDTITAVGNTGTTALPCVTGETGCTNRLASRPWAGGRRFSSMDGCRRGSLTGL